MNSSTAGHHFRGNVNGSSSQRLTSEDWNGATSPPSAPGAKGMSSATSSMSRAERFEDEKKRIIESCFGKKDADGSSPESYITHIRIDENADYPSTPPPLESPAENRKPRVIMIAVKKSGRVRMHKGRENANHTFSVGKTWSLDDLTRIESFTHAIPQTAEQQQNKQRAGATGFIITIGKPYYWQAGTAKEKEFFIFSLIKIYRKYTGGKVPDLVGFSPQELEQLNSAASSSSSSQTRSQTNGGSNTYKRTPSSEPPIGYGQDRPSSRGSHNVAVSSGSRFPSQEPGARFVKPGPEPNGMSKEHGRRPSGERGTPTLSPPKMKGQDHRALHSATSRERSTHTSQSNDRVNVPGSFPSTDSIPSQLSSSQSRPKRSASPGSSTTLIPTNVSRAPSEHRSIDAYQGDQDRDIGDNNAGRSSNEQAHTNGTYAMTSKPRDPSQKRPTVLDNNVANTASLRTAGHRKQSLSNGFGSGSEHGIHARNLTARGVSSHSTNNNPRGSSHLGRSIDRDQDVSAVSSHEVPRLADAQFHDIQQNPAATLNRSTAKTLGNEVTMNESVSTPPVDSDIQLFRDNSPHPTDPVRSESEVHRPGLGPMIKKRSQKEIASQFRKAATTYNAFKARSDAVVDKSKEGQSNSGDGITGVFQAPSLLKTPSQDDSRPATPEIGKLQEIPVTPEHKIEGRSSQAVNSSPQDAKLAERDIFISNERSNSELRPSTASNKPPVPPQDERRKKRRSDHSAKYATTLGIPPSLLEGRCYEIEGVLNDFGWGDENSKMTFDELNAGIRKELTRIEAGSWLGALDNSEDRSAAIGDVMDKVVAECEELDCLLTLYNVELGTLSEDIAYIEAQSQGLQVQTANQKLLHTELQNLLDTISISSSQLRALKDGSLSKPRGLSDVEKTLGQLYSAMLTIDPSLRSEAGSAQSSEERSNTALACSELSSMQAVREKRDGYRRESKEFVQRFKQFIPGKFSNYEADTSTALRRLRDGHSTDPTKLDVNLRRQPKRDLWQYSPIMLFVRQVEPRDWDDLLRLYEGHAKRPYLEEFRENVLAWKRITRKPVGDEAEVLFTVQEKEPDGLVGRKLTVKRTKTVRTDGSSRISIGDKSRDGRVTAYEAFAGALTEEAKVIFVEQNFVVDMFHVSSSGSNDFLDSVVTDPESRQDTDLLYKKPFDADRNKARKVLGCMEEMFSSWPAEMQSLADWAVAQDALNTVGVLFAVESQLAEVEETNQEFLTQVLGKIHERVTTQFNRFIAEQVRGIEDTKVKIKKRKGVIAFIKTFPNFSSAIENMLPPSQSFDHLPVRSIVDEAYQSIHKAMFESLKFIAKEAPSANVVHNFTTEAEEKEVLNHHILLIENMNHYLEEVVQRENPVLVDWSRRAQAEMSEHLELYTCAAVHRPLGKLLDFIESTDTLLQQEHTSNGIGADPTAIATRPSHSRVVFKKLLASFDAQAVRRGIEILRKRVEKHFGEGDDSKELSRGLILKVCKSCEEHYLVIADRLDRLVKDVYEGQVEVDWKREDIIGAFRK